MTATALGSVANISELKALEESERANGMTVETSGYHAISDGGGGIYYFNAADTSDDNGGTIIKPNDVVDPLDPGRWLLIFDTISIRQFGAQTGDPSQVSSGFWADNAARVQAAIDYCASQRIGLYAIQRGQRQRRITPGCLW